MEHIAIYIKANLDYSEMVSLFSDIAEEGGYHSFEDFLNYIHAAKRFLFFRGECIMKISFYVIDRKKRYLRNVYARRGVEIMSADNLANLLDALTNTSVYVIEEETRRLLYFNRRCQLTGRGKAVLGAKCQEIWPELCCNCPLDAMEDKSTYQIVSFSPILETTVDITANRILWEGRIRAVVLTATPHQLNFEEEQGLRKIEQIYAQSLVTVFDECVIVNLTRDYYVNCQKDAMWTDIPEQGDFSAGNRERAKKVLHPDDLQLFNENFSREAMLSLFGEGRKKISMRLRRLTNAGVYHMVEFTAARIERLGERECWCALVFRDVQDEYSLEQRRRVEISQLATAAKIAYQMLIAVNLTKNTYHMLNYARFPIAKPDNEGCFDTLIHLELATVHPDYQKEFIRKFSRDNLIGAFSRGERIVSMEIPHRGEDGVYHWNFTQVVRVESAYTDDLLEITLSRNIDEERRMQDEALEKERRSKQILEDALQKAEKASLAKSDFLSKMSHDIRTPMNAIIGMTELAQLHIGDETRLRDYLKKIASSGAHLFGLIDEILDVGKIESGAIELAEDEFDLRDLARDAVEMTRILFENKRQKISLMIADKLYPQVRGDARRLKQVLVNILENASKYTGEDGAIKFFVEDLKKEEERVGAYRFVIEDNGIGMKPDYLRHIFEPFSRADDSRTSKVAGTGLGMTIVKNLVSVMGGKIQVESEYKKGSRFLVTFCLMKVDAPLAASSEKELQTEDSFPEIRALLVEDNELNRQIAAEMLALLKARVEIAEDGRQAVETVCARPPFYYDIVFMDIQMPVLNGYDATREIRSSGMKGTNELFIVAMTADAFAEDAKQARLAGMDGHLAKPISIEQLKNVLLSCLGRKRRKRMGEIAGGKRSAEAH